jgi:hypothetical protein
MSNARKAMEETSKTTEIKYPAGFSYEYRVIDKKPRITVYKDGVRIDGATFPRTQSEVGAKQEIIDRNKTTYPDIVNMKRIN